MKAIITLFYLILHITAFAGDPKVTLHLLDDTGKSKSKEKFYIDWSDTNRAIEKTKVIEGEDAKKVLQALKDNLSTSKSSNFCGHDPIYGIVAVSASGKKLTTSLCFKCVTWVKPKKRLNIKGKHGVDNPLCLVLRKHIELPESVLTAEANKSKQTNS